MARVQIAAVAVAFLRSPTGCRWSAMLEDMRHAAAAMFVLLSMVACATDPAVSPGFAFRESALERDKVEDPLPALRACWSGPEPAFPPHGVKRCWFGRFLEAMGEESLARRGVQQAYRFLWLRTWRRPLMVRVERTGGGGVWLEAKETDGATWIVEGLRAGEQRTVALSTAHVVEAELEQNAALRDAAVRMLELAGVDVSRLEVY